MSASLFLLDFISENEDWQQKIQELPYSIKLVEDENFILLKYNQLESDFTIPLVRECRGIILDKNTLKPVCIPFFKFANYGESYADIIDWNTAKVQEKIDGSLIKVWNYDGEWHISTNGMIDAYKTFPSDFDDSFGSLFEKALKKYPNHIPLNKEYTYMFELTSPYNRVVVPFDEVDIHHIGTRDNETLKEIDMNIGIPKPKTFALKSFESCLEATSKMSFKEEGFVVVDKDWRRVKIKSAEYLKASYLACNNNFSKKRFIEIIKAGEQSEFLSYFADAKKEVDKIIFSIDEFCISVKSIWHLIEKKNFSTRKELALFLNETFPNQKELQNIFFSIYNGKIDGNDVKKWLMAQQTSRIINLLFKEER